MTRAALLMLLALIAACEDEDRASRTSPPENAASSDIRLSSLIPGGAPTPLHSSGRAKEFEENAYHVSQGQRLFTWFNCVGCHAHGGGGSGPPLMDDQWIYGGSIENIVATIKEGRPNGMPSFRGLIPEDQVWELAAYVRSMSRNVPKAAAPTRTDSLNPGVGESRRQPLPPKPAGNPAASDTQ